MKRPLTYSALGLMSGTSLDGLDLALCEFLHHEQEWKFRIISSKTIPYSEQWKKTLGEADKMNGRELIDLDHKFGRYTGMLCRDFLGNEKQKPDLIASHGHTVFHEPEKGFSYQIGNGNDIAAITGLPVVYDFRSLDISLGGQGAPLVPVGDKLLFGEYDICLNLGGFSNISYDDLINRMAFDICPVNIILNKLSEKKGKEYDRDGRIGRQGKIHQVLLEKLNQIGYYHQSPPKSLGKEFLEKEFFPVLDGFDIAPEDELRTCYEHIAIQIAAVINSTGKENVMITGGGAKNIFLTELLKERCDADINIPSEEVVDYKEALIFAFLGLLRTLNQANCLSSVTGAGSDSSSGIMVIPPV